VAVGVVVARKQCRGLFIGRERRWSGGGRWGGRRAVRGGFNGAWRREAEQRAIRGGDATSQAGLTRWGGRARGGRRCASSARVCVAGGEGGHRKAVVVLTSGRCGELRDRVELVRRVGG